MMMIIRTRGQSLITPCFNTCFKDRKVSITLMKKRSVFVTGQNMKMVDWSKYQNKGDLSRTTKNKSRREVIVRKRKLIEAKKFEIVKIKNDMTVAELAKAINLPIERIGEAIQYLEPNRRYLPNHIIEKPFLIRCIIKLGRRYKFENEKALKEEENILEDHDVYKCRNIDKSKLTSRPPIVTIMGHVDHGKTTLLDSLRKTSVAEKEAGGITQKIGAFAIEVGGRKITFLDTPGHASFSAMRQRGAQLTDIVVLVVAADDGVMEQTIESIKMIKQAGVEVVVAINKCDLPNAQPQVVSQELIEHEIQTEDMGGSIQSVKISAKTGEGLPDLLESLFVQADMLDPRANINGNVEGVVVESRHDKHKGFIGSCVMQQGTLTKGKFLVAGLAYAKVKSLQSESGAVIKSAPPSLAVDILGWKSLPTVGENVLQVPTLARAKQVIKYREYLKTIDKNEIIKTNLATERKRDREIYKEVRKNIHTQERRAIAVFQETKRFYDKKTTDGVPNYKIILKADVDGSLDALLQVLKNYDCQQQCVMEIIDSGVGPVTKHDIELAKLFQGSIFSFNLEPSQDVVSDAAENEVQIHHTDIIYRFVEILKSEIENILPCLKSTDVVGEAEVLKTFQIRSPKKLAIGVNVKSGSLKFNLPHNIIRNDNIIFEGDLLSIRHHKTNVDEIQTGTECALIFKDDHEHPEPGDIIQCCNIFDVVQKLNWNPPGF